MTEGKSNARVSLFHERLKILVGALVAIVDGNASTAAGRVALNLHVAVAKDSTKRWPNDVELSDLSCWVLLAAV